MGRPSLCSPETIDAICDRLVEGESLSSICRDPAMPSWRAVHDWMADSEINAQITRAREQGFMARADRAVMEAKTAEDAAKGRLAFDAERWYLGKLSNAFAEKSKVELTGKDGGSITVKADKAEWTIIDPPTESGA